MGLFEPPIAANSFGAERSKSPLADRMRPETLEEFVGQLHILGPGKPLRQQIERDELHSLILWGPPGSGKTTLATIVAKKTRSDFVKFSAVLVGIKEIKEVMAAAEKTRQFGRRTVLFIDEIHRFNKAQQDAFLPYVERGDIILIGATTENPSFEVISALLSRAKVYMLSALSTDEVVTLLERALKDEKRGLGAARVLIAPELLKQIAVFANGDARAAFNTLETAVTAASRDEAEDHNTGVLLLRGLHAYLRDQSRASRRFFRDVVHDARVMRLLDESAAVVGRWHEQHRTGEREAFDRMQRMRSLEFAQTEAAKLRDLLPARGVGAGISIH